MGQIQVETVATKRVYMDICCTYIYILHVVTCGKFTDMYDFYNMPK